MWPDFFLCGEIESRLVLYILRKKLYVVLKCASLAVLHEALGKNDKFGLNVGDNLNKMNE